MSFGSISWDLKAAAPRRVYNGDELLSFLKDHLLWNILQLWYQNFDKKCQKIWNTIIIDISVKTTFKRASYLFQTPKSQISTMSFWSSADVLLLKQYPKSPKLHPLECSPKNQTNCKDNIVLIQTHTWFEFRAASICSVHRQLCVCICQHQTRSHKLAEGIALLGFEWAEWGQTVWLCFTNHLHSISRCWLRLG